MSSTHQKPPQDLPQLVAKAQEGDTEAFAEIYDFYATPVYRYVVFRFPRELAEDIVADIFVKAWEKLHTYKAQRNVPFAAWLFRIARYTVIDAYRTQRGFEEIPETLVDEEATHQPRDRMEQQLLLSTVRKAMNALPRRYRDALLLSYVSELKNAEIAQVLRMREGGVRILKFRALKKMKKLLPDSLQDLL